MGEELKDKILARRNPDGSPATLVIRPDSGDPVKTTLKGMDILLNKFGYSINDKKYKVLPPQVRMIWGDGIDIQGISDILLKLKQNFISADNITFGMGGGLLQKCNRDTLKIAIKCSYAIIDNKPTMVYKDPITQKGKKSKKGILSLIKKDNKYITIEDTKEHPDNLLIDVFENGKLLVDQKFEDIVNKSKINIDGDL